MHGRPRLPAPIRSRSFAGSHTMKGGIYGTWSRYATDSGSFPYQGSFDFGTNVNNPFDTNYPLCKCFARDLQSRIRRAQPDPLRIFADLDMEWYVQDTWKATRRLTLNYGMRFSYYTPWHQANGRGLNFVPSLYDPAHAVQLYARF